MYEIQLEHFIVTQQSVFSSSIWNYCAFIWQHAYFVYASILCLLWIVFIGRILRDSKKKCSLSDSSRERDRKRQRLVEKKNVSNIIDGLATSKVAVYCIVYEGKTECPWNSNALTQPEYTCWWSKKNRKRCISRSFTHSHPSLLCRVHSHTCTHAYAIPRLYRIENMFMVASNLKSPLAIRWKRPNEWPIKYRRLENYPLTQQLDIRFA